jgi:hypothetical protein
MSFRVVDFLVCFARTTKVLPGLFVGIQGFSLLNWSPECDKSNMRSPATAVAAFSAKEIKMKTHKNVSAAKLAANKQNGRKSRGPKSIPGKERAKRNAITHAFYARELVLSDTETRRWETLGRRLHPELSPQTVLQNLKFAEIMVWIGRCMLGLRLDMLYVNRLLGQDNPSAQPDRTDGERAGPEWYLSNRQGLREAIRLPGEIKEEFLSLGRIDEKWHAVLDRAFGPRLREIITPWMPSPSHETTVMVAQFLTEHAETYNLPLPPSLDPKARSSAEDGGDDVKVVLDPEQSKRMVVKLFEQQESLLSDLWRSAEERALSAAREQNAPSDPPRHFSAACRELDRAIERFMYLKKNNL